MVDRTRPAQKDVDASMSRQVGASSEPSVPLDGRMLRSERTRTAIVDAHAALMNEGDLQPTAVRVAERAGVSLRTFWSHFSDTESLFAAAGAKTQEIARDLYQPVPVDQPLSERIGQFCRQRVRMLEAIAGASRAAQIRIPFSPALQASRAQHNSRLRSQIEELFAAEIAAAGEAGDELTTALMVAATWPAWMGSRDDLGLSVHAAASVMHRSVTALLACTSVPPFHLGTAPTGAGDSTG